MKKKFVVILVLLALLVYTVYQMMQYEQSIREDHIITKYVEDETKPLIVKFTGEKLREIVKNINPEFRSGNSYIQVKQQGEWKDVFLKGVNLGVAVPGKFPAEFSLTFDEYLKWLIQIGKMNSNVIRTYTILPPDFYKALAYYNLHHSEHKIYLLQGIWATIPEKEDYYNPQYIRSFQKEIIDVIDVIHGQAVLPPRPGKASGVYATDISKHVIGFLLGREWEPKAVNKTIHKHQNFNHFNGDFISLPKGNAMEVWLAQRLDFTLRYETQKYREQRPVSFVNWLPLDPMYHNTEFIENKKVREYDNDLMQIDFTRFNATGLNKSGIYAAYHVYPYYPDFIYLNPKYRKLKNGRFDNFFAYLSDLKQHTPGMPLIIAEYGLPSSRGVSHFTPSGYNQGGHSEAQQATYSLQLTKDIVESKCAGAIYFEWADEWFKHNWLVMDFEVPFHDRKLWHNMENPEQNFGILALEDKKIQIDGNLSDWNNDQISFQDNGISIYNTIDATYFYIAGVFPEFDFSNNNLYIAFDTYRADKGDRKLPFSDKIFDNGFEFLGTFTAQNKAKILVDEPYSVFTDIYNDYIPVYASKPNRNGIFIDQLMLVNRGRESLTGEHYDSIINNRSPLQHGNSGKAETSNADWYWNPEKKQFELRLDWHLLNVSDPAKKFVLDDKANSRIIEASQTDGIRFYVFITDKNNRIIKQIPTGKPLMSTWTDWTQPAYSQRLKPVYDSLKQYFAQELISPEKTPEKQEKTRFEIAAFQENKKAAVSIIFDNFGYSQYQYAYPLLNKYLLKAGFSYSPEHIKNLPVVTNFTEGINIKRLGYKQIKEIQGKGNEAGLQLIENSKLEINQNGISVSYIDTNRKKQLFAVSNAVFIRQINKTDKPTQYNGIRYIPIPQESRIKELDSLTKQIGQWFVVNFHHIYKDSSEVKNIPEKVLNKYFTDYETFRRKVRLLRNTGYWIDSPGRIYKYLYERKHSKISVKNFDNTLFLQIKNNLNPNEFNVPLTVNYFTRAKKINIKGAVTDGIYNNKTGIVSFEVMPNTVVSLSEVN